MRVVYISNSTIPSRAANSLHVMKMCQALRQLGHDVELIAKKPHPPSAGPVDLWHHYGISDPFPIHLLRPTARLHRTVYAFRAVLRAKRTRADVVYTRNYIAAPLAAWSGLQTIYEAHGLQNDHPRRLCYRLLWRSRQRHRFVTITRALAEDFRRAFPSQLGDSVIEVLPDAVDLERFEGLLGSSAARTSVGWPERLTVGYAGHLYPGRGVDLLLDLAEQLPEWRFSVMGGTDADVDRYRGEVARRRLANVHLLGFIPNAELPRYLAACDVLAMPHQRAVSAADGGNIAAWTSPMKMFEYLATGRLILASELPVLREVLNDANAVLCSPDDLSDWVAALQRADADPAWRHALADQARLDAERYTWRARAERGLATLRHGH